MVTQRFTRTDAEWPQQYALGKINHFFAISIMQVQILFGQNKLAGDLQFAK